MLSRLYSIGSRNSDLDGVSGACEIWQNSMIINDAISGLNNFRRAAWIDGGVHFHLSESAQGLSAGEAG